MTFRTNVSRGSNGHGVALFSGALVAESANATNLQVTTQPGLSGVSPYTLSPQPVVTAKKSLGTTDTAYVTVVVASLNVLSGSPVLSGTTSVTPVSGVATFTNLVVTGAGTWTLTFTSGTLASAVSSTGTTTSSSAATKLTITTAPGLSGTTPYTLSPQPVVAAQNAGGTTDTSYVTNVVASLNVLTGSPVLSGTTTQTPVSGVATFTDLVVTGAGTWTITFTSGTLTSATSSTGTTTSGGFTPFSAGFNFRNTLGWATDQTNEVFVGGEAYPHTYTLVGGATVVAGFTSSNSTLQPRDRATSGGVDRRLNGVIFDSTNAPVFQVDVPAAGTYTVHLALGDADNPQTVSGTVKDGATTRITIGSTSLAAGHSVDAAGTDLTVAAWPGSNAGVSITMAGTILTLNVPVNADIQHLSVVRTS